VLHIAPEAQVGGTLTLLRNGDIVRFDAPNQRLDILVSDNELDARTVSLDATEGASWARLWLDVLAAHPAGRQGMRESVRAGHAIIGLNPPTRRETEERYSAWLRDRSAGWAGARVLEVATRLRPECFAS